MTALFSPASGPRRIRTYPEFPPRRWPIAPRRARPFPLDGRRPILAYRLARAAIHHGLQALGVGPGDEVLMPIYHHGVEVAAVRALGAAVRFYPLGPDLGADPAALAPLLGPRTRVLYVTHYFGFPQPLAPLADFCRQNRLWLFEDCSLSLLGEHQGTPLGSVGQLAVFCLYKHLPVRDGGLLVLGRARPRLALGLGARLRSLLPTREEAEAAGCPYFHPVQLERAMALSSQLLLGRIDLDEVRQRRRRHYDYWSEVLGERLRPLHPRLPEGACPLFYPALVADKPGLHRALLGEGIELANWWSHGSRDVPPGADRLVDELRAHLVGLPVHQELEPADLERIRRALERHLR